MDLNRVKLLLCYRKSYNPSKGISHVGLGISCMHIQKMLIQNGVDCILKGLVNQGELQLALQEDPSYTHVVVAAPWMDHSFLAFLCDKYPGTIFAVNCHSNWGFLAAEPGAITLLRQGMSSEATLPNFHIAGNCHSFCETVLRVYNVPCTWLPNCYYLDHTHGIQRPTWNTRGGPINIGMFGAARTQKNFLPGLMAIMQLARDYKVQINVSVNGGRNDGGEMGRIWAGLVAASANVPNVNLIRVPWMPWDQFRAVIDGQDLCWQPSTSESFNLVVADAASKAVASVTTEAIDWVPEEWKAPADNPTLQARTGSALLNDPVAGTRGLEALERHNEQAVDAWFDYLANNEFGVGSRPFARFNHPRNLRQTKYRIHAA